MPDAQAAGWAGRLIGEAAVIPTLTHLRTRWPDRRATSVRGAFVDAARPGDRPVARPEVRAEVRTGRRPAPSP